VPCAGEREDKHSPSFFSQRDRPDPAILAALYATDKPLLIQAIHRDADRSGIEVDLRPNGIHWHRSLVEQYFENRKSDSPNLGR